MRKVFGSHKEVCQVWAGNTQEEGRSGNISFEFERLYSYGHYEIARLYPEQGVCLVVLDTYSVSTAHHISIAARAAREQSHNIIYVADTGAEHDVNIPDFLDRLRKTVVKFDSAVSNGRWILNENQGIYDDLTAYCKAFGLQMPVTLGLYLDPKYPFIKKRFYKEGDRELFLPRWVVKRGIENLTAQDLFRTKNAEIRRLIISKVGGIGQGLKDLNATTLDTRGDYKLLLVDLRDGRECKYLSMKNPSVAGAEHIEGIHPACKTVQDALNFRRYGNTLFETVKWSERAEYARHPERMKIRNDVENWNPTVLT